MRRSGGQRSDQRRLGGPLRSLMVSMALCSVLAGGLLFSGAQALAANGEPEAPITEACGGPISPGVVRLCGTLNPHASAKVGYYFAYNTGASCVAGSKTPTEAEVEGKGIKVSSELTGLEPGTEYTYCLVATNSHGETFGGGLTFKTEGEPITESSPGEVQTGPAEQTVDGFKLKGKLNPENSPTSYYFIYKKAGEVECEDLEGCGPETTHGGPLTGDTQQEVSPAEVTGLAPNTTYIYWLIARNARGTAVGRQLTFTTGPEEAPSEVVTEPAESGSNGFRLTGKLNPGGLPTTYYFEYIADDAVECVEGENCWPETAHAGPITGDSQQGVGSIEVTGLRLGETYRYRLVAENAKGTERGNMVTFTVTQTFPASVGSESVSNVTENGATLEAQVNPHGEETYLTTWVFEYGTSTAYGQSIPTPPGLFNSEACKFLEIIPCGINTPQPVSESLTGLEPGTTYHYRIAATNSWGTSYGEDRTFTTLSSRARPLGGEPEPTGGGIQSGASSATGQGGASGTPGGKPPGSSGKTVSHKVLTRGQELAKALKQCEKEPKHKRAECKKQAHKKYALVEKKSKKK
jgi:hypothetical protein